MESNTEKKTVQENTVEEETKETVEATETEDIKEEPCEKCCCEEGKHEGKHHHHKEDVKELKTQITELEGQIAILKNDYAKAYADTENIRKRLNAEAEQSRKYRIQDFALDILPVIDNCERALEHETSDENYRKGVEMIYNQLMHALNKEGVEVIDCLDKPFDANFQQALMVEHVEGKEPGIVIQVLQKGYKLKDRILRAAMVKVSE